MSMLRAVLLSLAVHFLMWLFISYYPAEWARREAPAVAEIEIINRPLNEKTAQQIVRQALVPEKMKLIDDSKARFFSEQKQRVILETRAQNFGLTQNNNPNLPQTKKTAQNTQDSPRKKDQAGYEPIRLPRPNEIQTEGPSTVGEMLPKDMAMGSFTALNTDKFQYYSFFSRVEELVRFRWETQVRQAVDSFDRSYVMNQIGRKNWLTQVEFLITPEGHLKTARILKESGVKGFDQASIIAFRDARFFPNPPKELIEEDGYIHLRYAFNVYFEPSALASGE